MKTSLVIGVVMLYLVLMGLESWVSGGTGLGSNAATSSQSVLMQPAVTESGAGALAAFTGAWAVITGVATYIVTLLGIFVLWSPTVFASYGLWLWWGVCFPTDVAMVFAIVGMVRGVHSA